MEILIAGWDDEEVRRELCREAARLHGAWLCEKLDALEPRDRMAGIEVLLEKLAEEKPPSE